MAIGAVQRRRSSGRTGSPSNWRKFKNLMGHRSDAIAHMFRDTFAVELLPLAGGPLDQVSLLLGYSH
jgi:hypothetical protein